MDANTSRFSLLKPIVHFMGASILALLLSIGIHETGHYLAGTILGASEKPIALDPFGADYNIYLRETYIALDAPLKSAFSGASGPLFNLLITVTISLLLWRKRSPKLLPLLLLGSTALLQEGIGMILDVMAYPMASADWSQTMQAGVPLSLISLLGVVMLVAGCIWMFEATDSHCQQLPGFILNHAGRIPRTGSPDIPLLPDLPESVGNRLLYASTTRGGNNGNAVGR